MSFELKAISGRNSSALVAYYLRTTETGWYATTDILKNDEFREALTQNIEDRAAELNEKLAQMGASSKAYSVEERLRQLKVRVPKPVGGKPAAQKLVQTVHKASLSMLLNQKTARTGNIFQIQLPNHAAGNAADIAKKVRDLFPPSAPMMVTVHTGDNNKNLHLQGWFSEKEWDAQTKSWGSPLQQFRTKTGLADFRAKIDRLLEESGAAWTRDPNAPKRTVFHPAKSQFMKSLPHSELLKGDFLNEIQNPVLKQCLQQEVAIARYNERKREAAKRFVSDVDTITNDLKTAYSISKPAPEKPAQMKSTEFSSAEEIEKALEAVETKKFTLRRK